VTGISPWLHQTRWLVFAAQDVLLLIAFANGERPWAGLAITVLAGVFEAARRQRDADLAPAVQVVVDVLLVGLFVTAWADPHSPLRMFWLVHVALVASHTAPRSAWSLAAFVVAVDLATALVPPWLGWWRREPGVHLGSHAATLGAGAIALTAFLTRIAETQRLQARALAEAQGERDRAARLAAVGALAAGVAHELATPLASIGLLAEEIPEDPAAIGILRDQLARCRAILDRMLARGTPDVGATEGFGEALATWVADWRRGNPEVALEVVYDPLPDRVVGSAEGWRAAVWTVLDNARKAGPPLAIRARSTPSGAELVVEDAGPGFGTEVLERIGEPFFTAWSGGNGVGLGVHVARTHARGAGGDLRFADRPGGGGRVTVVFRGTNALPGLP
jgi:two-component system, sensor histidine kinase RegB